MSGDLGLGHILIAFRDLALARDANFEAEVDEAVQEAQRQLEVDWQRARETSTPFGGLYMRFICDNDFRIRRYLQDGGQLDLITPAEARDFLTRSREQGA